MWLIRRMDILLVSATSAEIAPLTENITANWMVEDNGIFSNNKLRIHFLTTGVGMVATTYSVLKQLQQCRFDFVLQAGIAGSFNKRIALGTVVAVEREVFGDLGAEDHYNFIDVFELGLTHPDEHPFVNKNLVTPDHQLYRAIDLPRVSSLSINSVSGSSFTAEARYKKYGCELESMEGAAFHYVCLSEKVPFAQVRAVSNYVEARDRSKWEIGKAIGNLNSWLINFMETLSPIQ